MPSFRVGMTVLAAFNAVLVLFLVTAKLSHPASTSWANVLTAVGGCLAITWQAWTAFHLPK